LKAVAARAEEQAALVETAEAEAARRIARIAETEEDCASTAAGPETLDGSAGATAGRSATENAVWAKRPRGGAETAETKAAREAGEAEAAAAQAAAGAAAAAKGAKAWERREAAKRWAREKARGDLRAAKALVKEAPVFQSPYTQRWGFLPEEGIGGDGSGDGSGVVLPRNPVVFTGYLPEREEEGGEASAAAPNF